MHRVKAKVEAERDKKQQTQAQKRSASEDKNAQRPTQRRRSSQPKSAGLEPSPISPLAPSLSSIGNATGTTASPTSAFPPVGTNGTQSITPQSQSGSSPGGPELMHPFTMGQSGVYTSFGNSPPLFPIPGQLPLVNLPAEVTSDVREEDNSGQFWQLFGPPGSALPPHNYGPNFVYEPQQTNTSPIQVATEFQNPNNVNTGHIPVEGASGVNLEDIDSELVDWGEFIAHCSQVWAE
jgi:hypothetical protein